MKNYTKKEIKPQTDVIYEQLLQTIGNYHIARFAIEFCPPLTQEEIASKFGITQGRLSVIVKEYKAKAEKRGAK